MGYFIDGSQERVYGDYGFVGSSNKEHMLKVHFGGAGAMGTIFIDNREVFTCGEEMFEELRVILNELWSN